MNGLERFELCNSSIFRNESEAKLVELAVKNNEGFLSDRGGLVVHTGKYTGRSPKDRFIVKQKSIYEKVNWGDINLPMDEIVFERLYEKVLKYLGNKTIYVFDGYVGALKEYALPLTVVCEYASQALFANQMFIRAGEKEIGKHTAEFTVISAPGFKADPEIDGTNSEVFIIINFEKKVVLIGGTQYSGEIKKSMFSVMNFLLPQKGIFPMHCSANKGDKEDVAVFFGLSGTGKTTLSADPSRKLIGDDEHGWCDEGIFNFEGGCYAKTINLDKEKEKEIYEAIRFGTILENVIVDEKCKPVYEDCSLTENTRAAYPLDHISNVEVSGTGGAPGTIIFLTADAFGVLPPIAKLTSEGAMYHFLSGYTSKLAGTERGIKEPKATFSACFGEPFMLMNPAVYARLLGEKIEENNVDVYLVNTGWCGGAYGTGVRIKLSYTRAMVTAALNGSLRNAKYFRHPIFNVFVPEECEGVPKELLNPENMWNDKAEYEMKALKLAEKFQENMKKFDGIPDNILSAAPGKEFDFSDKAVV